MAKVGARVKAGSPLRAIPPAWPSSRGEAPTTPNYDRLVNMALSRLIAMSKDPDDPRRQRLCVLLPILARDAEGQRQERERMANTTCIDNTLRYAVELFSRADQRTGFVGRPPGSAGLRWERFHQYRLGSFAFGKYVPGEVGPSRSKRADQRLKEIGWITRSIVKRKVRKPGGPKWVSDVSILHVTRLFWGFLGLLGDFKSLVRGGERAEGEARARQLASRRPARPVPPAAAAKTAPAAPVPIERSDRPPPLTSEEQLERFKAARALIDAPIDSDAD